MFRAGHPETERLAVTTTEKFLSGIQESYPGQLIGKSNHMVIAALQLVHVFGILLLLASLILVSLRLLGLTLREHNLASVTREPAILLWIGLGMAVGSGILIFISGPAHYYYNKAFDVKMLLLVCAVAMHILGLQRLARSRSVRPLLARLVVALSLILWFGVGVAGRAIGFV
jgi:hypothetical protein